MQGFSRCTRQAMVMIVCPLSVVPAMTLPIYAAPHEQSKPHNVLPWPNNPPAGIPFAQSPTFSRITFTGSNAAYASSDTWYPSWASDSLTLHEFQFNMP